MPIANRDAAMRRVMQVAKMQGPSAAHNLINQYSMVYSPADIQMAHDAVQKFAKGGMVQYRQTGGVIADDGTMNGQPVGAPVPQGNPQMPSPAPVGAPPAAPMAPPVPMVPMMQEAPQESFFDKFQKARDRVKKKTSMDLIVIEEPMPAPMATPMMDGQGDGPVQVHPEAGMLAPMEVGPDMGVDTVDAELEEGSFVMNPEGSELFAEELQMMMHGGYVHG